MIRLRTIQWGLALFIFTSVHPNLARRDEACGITCSTVSSKSEYRYLEGQTYKYNFESAIQISLPSVGKQQTSTAIKATVLLSPKSSCKFLLQVRNVEITGATNSQKFSSIAGIDKPIQFTFENGVIDDQFCADPEDSQNSLNIKRAIASLFQVDNKRDYETDIFGVCPTESTVRQEAGDVVITKNRNLDKCVFREHIKENFIVPSFNSESDIKSIPLMGGEYESVQKLKNGILNVAYVYENYTYFAFSYEDKDTFGAKAQVVTKLAFIENINENIQSKVSEPKSIIFDNPHPITIQGNNADSIYNAVKKLNGLKDVVAEYSARDFLDLVKILRDSNKEDIVAIYHRVKNEEGTKRKAYLEALFRCGSADAIVSGVELLKNRELDDKEEKLFYLSFAFVKHTTIDALDAVSSLLGTNAIPREAYLGIGNLVGSYCREHACEIKAVNKLIGTLEARLGDGKAKSRDEENEFIYILKALSNVLYWNDHVRFRITSIAEDQTSSTRLRAAALDTFSSQPCHYLTKNVATVIMQDIQEDSELRIKAYLIMVKCPNSELADVLKKMLDDEPSIQVGGYIVTHLRNLKTSRNPEKKKAAEFLRTVETHKKFSFDPRKYSFNTENPYYLGGASGFMETDLIYSQNSFIPRTTALNLTAQICGHDVNLLDIQLRQQNLDRIVEHYFGSLGVFNVATPDEIQKAGQHSIDKILEHLHNRYEKMRSKRDISKAEIDDFANQVQIQTNELNNEVDLDLSVKLFGSDLIYLNIYDDAQELSPEGLIDRVFDTYERDVLEVRDFDKEVQTNGILIDSDFTYPTSLGLPLRLNVEGSSAVQIKAKGHIDVPTMLDGNPNGGLFKLSLIPSANVEIAASITVDAQMFESGLKVVGNLYTATSGDLEINFADHEQGVETKFSLPLEKQKLFSARQDVVLINRDLGKAEVLEPINFENPHDMSWSTNEDSPYLGLNFYADYSIPRTVEYPTPFLAGNSQVVIGVNNVDFSHFHYKEHHLTEFSEVLAEYVVEVVGKNQKPKSALKFKVGNRYDKGNNISVVVSLIAPKLQTSLELGMVTMNEDLGRLFSYDYYLNEAKYSGKIGYSSAIISNNEVRVHPILECSFPTDNGKQRTPLKVGGSFVFKSMDRNSKEYILDDLKVVLDLEQGKIDTYTANGNVGQNASSVFADLTLSDGKTNIMINGDARADRTKVYADWKFTNNRNPAANIRALVEFEFDMNCCLGIDIQLVHGNDLDSLLNRLTLAVGQRRRYSGDYISEFKSKIVYPASQLDLKFDYSESRNTSLIDIGVKCSYFSVAYILDMKTFDSLEGHDDAVANYGHFEEPKFTKVDTVLTINGDEYKAQGGVSYFRQYWNRNYNSDFVVNIPQVSEPIKVHEKLNYSYAGIDWLLIAKTTQLNLVDFVIRTTRNNSDIGLKVAYPDIFALNAYLRETRGVGNAEMRLDIGRKAQTIKADASFTAKYPIFDVQLTVWPDFERYPAQQYSLTTENKFKWKFYSTKNLLNLDRSVIVVNARHVDERRVDGHTFDVSFNTILPMGEEISFACNETRSFALKHMSTEKHFYFREHGIYNLAPFEIGLEKLLERSNYVDIDREYGVLVKVEKLHVDLFAKSKRQPDGKYLDESRAEFLYFNPNQRFTLHTNSLYDISSSGVYSMTSTLGNNKEYSVDVKGNYNFLRFRSLEDPLMTEISIEINTPHYDFSHLQLDAAFSLSQSVERITMVVTSGSILVNDVRRTPHAIYVNLKGKGEASIGYNDGVIIFKGQCEDGDPGIVDVKYTFKQDGTKFELNVKGDVHLESNPQRATTADITITLLNKHELKMDIVLTNIHPLPVHFGLHVKELKEWRVFNAEAKLIVNNKQLVLTQELDTRATSPAFNTELTYPDGAKDQIFIQLKLDGEIFAEAKLIIHDYDFNLHSLLTVEFESIENFSVKSITDCKSLHANGFTIHFGNGLFGRTDRLKVRGSMGREIVSEKKQLLLIVTNDGMNLVSGDISYVIHEQRTMLRIEGEGKIRIRDEDEKKLKYSAHQEYIMEENRRTYEYVLNAKWTKESLEGKFRLTRDGYTLLTTLCDTKSECKKLISSSIKLLINREAFDVSHETEIDLTHFGSINMGVKESITLHGYLLDVSSEVFLDPSKKYKCRVFNNKNDFGASLLTPGRLISLEGNLQMPESRYPGRGNVQVDLYMNKLRHPEEKTFLLANYNCNKDSKVGRCNAEVKFGDPALSKDLSIVYTSQDSYAKVDEEYSLIIDIFENPESKLVFLAKATESKLGDAGVTANVLYHIKSNGLDVDLKHEENFYYEPSQVKELKYKCTYNFNVGKAKYDNSLSFNANLRQATLILSALNREVINMESKYLSEEANFSINSTLNIMETPTIYVDMDGTVTSLKTIMRRSDRPTSWLELIVQLWDKSVMDINLRHHSTGNTVDLFSVYLREGRSKPLYDYSQGAIDFYVLNDAGALWNNFAFYFGDMWDKARDNIREQVGELDDRAISNLPGFEKIQERYSKEMRLFREELELDHELGKVLEFIGYVFISFLEGLVRFCNRLEGLLFNTVEMIYLEVQKILTLLVHNVVELVKHVCWIIEDILEDIFEYIGKRVADINYVLGIDENTYKDLAIAVIKIIKALDQDVTRDVKQFLKLTRNYAVFQDLDYMLKMAARGEEVPDWYFRRLRKGANDLKDSFDSPAAKKFIEISVTYLEQVLRRKPIMQQREWSHILVSLYEAVEESLDDVDQSEFSLHGLQLALNTPVSTILTGDFRGIDDLLKSISRELKRLLPDEFYAVVARGPHVFTLDGNYFSFPGNCDYLLARDAVNGNFSIVGSYEDAQLASLTLADRYDTITIKNTGEVLLNNAPTKFPVRLEHRLIAYKDYETVNIVSNAGVKIVCGHKLMACGIHVSGYYHAQVRGLLGKGNNEPYDDYTLPTGLIVNDTVGFVNSYKMGGQCLTATTTHPMSDQQDPNCSRLFNGGSAFSACYARVNPENYRKACDVAMGAGIKDADLSIAYAYVASCTNKGVAIHVPNNFAKCTNYERPVAVEEEFRVSTPNKAADIVLVIDQDQRNEMLFVELIKPLVAELNAALTARGISDVEFHLIGFGGEYEKHPVHYGSQNNLAFKPDEIPNVQFSSASKENKKETLMEQFERLGDKVGSLTGQDMIADAYIEATKYPFRSHAVKSIILLTSQQCNESPLDTLRRLAMLLLVNEQFTVNLFAPVHGMINYESMASDVVAFNQNSMYSLSKPEGTKDGNRISSSNVCVQLALKNRGNVFPTNKYDSSIKSAYIQIATENIMRELMDVQQQLVCKCEMTSPYNAWNKCKVSDTTSS